MRHADRLGAAHAVILDDDGRRSSATCAPASSGRSTSRRWSRSSPDGERAWLPVPGAAAERLPRRLVRTGPRRTGSGRTVRVAGLGAPAARPRRAGLHRPARPDGHRAARLQPGHGRRRVRARPPAARRGRRQRRRRGGARARRDGQPRAADGRVRGPRRRGDAAGGRRDAAVRDRELLGRGGGGDAASPPLPRPAPRADAARRSSFDTRSRRRFGGS